MRGRSVTAVVAASLLLSGCVSATPSVSTLVAGVVAEGAEATVAGAGTVEVSFQREGDFAVVIGLDCSGCSGVTTLSTPGLGTALGETTAQTQAAFLMDAFPSDPVDQTLIIRATGHWTLTLQSWNDLPAIAGARSGTGSAVLAFSDDAARLSVDYGPASSEDSFSGRLLSTSGDEQTFGDTTAFSRVVDADLPGVVAIRTDGSWTLTPTP